MRRHTTPPTWTGATIYHCPACGTELDDNGRDDLNCPACGETCPRRPADGDHPMIWKLWRLYRYHPRHAHNRAPATTTPPPPGPAPRRHVLPPPEAQAEYLDWLYHDTWPRDTQRRAHAAAFRIIDRLGGQGWNPR